MKTTTESIRIEDLLAEADELIRQINSDIVGNLQEEHRLQFEIHTRELERIKTELAGKNLEKKTPKTGSLADGVHQAILDIVTAMHGLKKDLS